MKATEEGQIYIYVLDRVLHLVQTEYDYDATLDSVIGDDFYFDSLDVIEFTMSLEKEFSIDIPDNDMYSFDTHTSVRDVANYIVGRLKEKTK